MIGNVHVLFNPNRGDVKLGQVFSRLILRSHCKSCIMMIGISKWELVQLISCLHSCIVKLAVYTISFLTSEFGDSMFFYLSLLVEVEL